ncbi:myelin-oligodendrocyte glycoprotein-like isoform X1 [Echeneis naucrates]|uniref:myelin-oligodendrocyte glycoprotein-like isoform X1 n=1 Tax=Echeneis naucrates TaxID=173247 RepID=UPI001113EBCE|nr:myelin-oligodendrocyte glycoprotein-like isoform X1 [Echeneis naucrates]
MANLKFSFIVLLIFVCVLTLTGEYKVTFPTNPVRVSAGEDVILNCEVEPPFNLTEKTVEWKYFNTSNDEFLVHVFRNERDDPSSQDDKFKNRTSLFHDQLKEGNLSLKLLSVNLNDEGNYTCIVKKLNGSDRRGQIQLFVTARKKPEQQQNESGLSNDTTKGPHSVLCIVLSSVSVIILVVIITGPVLYKKRKSCRRKADRQEDAAPTERVELNIRPQEQINEHDS